MMGMSRTKVRICAAVAGIAIGTGTVVGVSEIFSKVVHALTSIQITPAATPPAADVPATVPATVPAASSPAPE